MHNRNDFASRAESSLEMLDARYWLIYDVPPRFTQHIGKFSVDDTCVAATRLRANALPGEGKGWWRPVR